MRDVAKLLSVSRATVHALIETGDLEASPLQSTKRKAQRVHVRIVRASLLKFYQKRFGHALNLALQNPFAA